MGVNYELSVMCIDNIFFFPPSSAQANKTSRTNAGSAEDPSGKRFGLQGQLPERTAERGDSTWAQLIG